MSAPLPSLYSTLISSAFIVVLFIRPIAPLALPIAPRWSSQFGCVPLDQTSVLVTFPSIAASGYARFERQYSSAFFFSDQLQAVKSDSSGCAINCLEISTPFRHARIILSFWHVASSADSDTVASYDASALYAHFSQKTSLWPFERTSAGSPIKKDIS